MNKTLYTLAKQLRKKIGAHVYLIGKQVKSDIYHNAQAESDEAVSLAKYLIQNLEDRHQAEIFAYQVGMPGYFYMAKSL